MPESQQPESTSLVRRLRRRLWLDLIAIPEEQFSALNGLRGFSAYLVVFFHAAIFSGNFPLVPEGKPDLNAFHRSINGFWVGLDVFFVLSGFLIGRILMSSLRRTATVEFWSFFTRRSMRIFPAYYLVLTIAILGLARLDLPRAWHFQGEATYQDLAANVWQNYLYILNYFFRTGSPNIMSWAWSLCVEEHFYLLLPLLLTLTFRFSRPRARPFILIVLTMLAFGGRVIQYLIDPSIVLLDGFYYRSHNRFDEPMIGVMIAYLYVFHFDAFKQRVERLGHWTWAIGFALIASVWIFGGLQDQGVFAVIFQFQFMALGAGFLITNALFLPNRVTRFFEHPFWYPVSRVSYGTYLTHIFVLYLVLEHPAFHDSVSMSPLRFTALFLVVMGSTVLVSSFMFVTVERPLIDLGRRISHRFRKPSLPDRRRMDELAHPPSRTGERGARRA